MQSTLNRTIYKAFGLNISSEVGLPELQKCSDMLVNAEIIIELADLTTIWNELAEPNSFCIVKNQTVIFQVPNVATFLIENGNKIMVSLMEGANESQVRLYILGSCMGALLLQRKTLPLHGSAIAINGKAYAVVGDSGAGKSTLASAFLNKGFKLLSDDVIPVSLNDGNEPVVTPAYPQQKLWQESLNAFGLNSVNYQPIFDRETKFTIPVYSQFMDNPIPLAGIFELVKTDGDEIKLEPIANLQVLPRLFYHTYRNFLVDHLGIREWHFQMTAKIVESIRVYQLFRPVERFTADELAAMILTNLKKEENVQ
jgi:hypothetical protein